MLKKLLLTTLISASGSSPAFAAGQKAAFTPESVLPKGVDSNISVNPYTGESGETRKGTVAATLNNIAVLNTLLIEKPSPENQAKIQEIVEAVSALLPSLRVIGVFDLFTPSEWLAMDQQPGRALVAVLYLQQYPKNITPEIKQRLVQIRSQTKVKLLSDAIIKALKG